MTMMKRDIDDTKRKEVLGDKKVRFSPFFVFTLLFCLSKKEKPDKNESDLLFCRLK